MMRTTRFVLLMVLGGPILTGTVWGLDGKEVVHRLQERFSNLESITARFSKRHYWKLVEQTQEIKGRLYVDKQHRFRLETPVQTVVTDGKTVWNYVPDNGQVIITSYETAKSDRSYEKLLFDLILLGGHSDRFSSEYLGQERVGRRPCHLVELVAKEEDAYISRVRLWVDRSLWLVRKVEYRNVNDDITSHTLTELKTNKDIDARLFTFDIPQGAEVVDLRPEKKLDGH